MRKYVHWLKITGMFAKEDIAEQFGAIEEYLKKYPSSKALIYLYDSGAYSWVVRLECEQCYRDLDMNVDCGLSYLVRLNSKPKHIGREKEFYFPEHYRV